MGRSFPEKLKRARHRIDLNNIRIAECEQEKRDLDLEIELLKKRLEEDLAICINVEARIERRDQEGLARSTTALDALSEYRPTRVRQVLNLVCRGRGLGSPEWIASLKPNEVIGTRTSALMDKFFMSDEFVGGLVPFEKRIELRDLALSHMKTGGYQDVDELENSGETETNEDGFLIAPGWAPDTAQEIAAHFRSESGLSAELAIQVSHRSMSVSTAWCQSLETGEWLSDTAQRFMQLVRPIGDPQGLQGKRAAAVIEEKLKKEKARSAAAINNDNLLKDAVAVFATPGAMAKAYRSGLSDRDRQTCATWFDDHREFALDLGHRVGSPAAFAAVTAGPEEFRERHLGAAPKNGPDQAARFWARRDLDVAFRAERPFELIQEARHALVDLTLNSVLVSMPKNRDCFLSLGSWEGNEPIHRNFIDVSSLVTKSFLTEAREAAEIELMQGANPLALTVGLVTWLSEDGKSREAPLFLARADFDEDIKSIARSVPFVLNRSLFRRIEADYPVADKSASIFDALQDVAVEPKLHSMFSQVIKAMAARTPGKSPILKIEDLCLVGSFDSSRAVLERRMDLKVFPSLVDNPVVRLLAEGSTQKLVFGEYDPKGARSPPDEIQRLAVKAILGGTSFVLEGPPGTGKTATIVSMLEALNKAGKRVLVTAAMPGAVEVIGRRIAGRFPFSISTIREKEIDIGVKSEKVDFKDIKGNVFLGTPIALIKDMPSEFTFDVLIVDEGSQLRLSHALALAGHVKQVVIAGDSRQLQPADSNTGKATETSLLARARQAGFPFVMLENHYRSRHPSLIAWSNMFSYESKLKPKKGPWLLGDAGLDVIYIDTGRRVRYKYAHANFEEADRIANEVVRWAKDGRRTVGVAALTQAQRDLIRKTVEERLAKAGISMRQRQAEEKGLEASEGAKRPIGFFSSKEPFFIRTAGAVQGEERDIMLISLGVGSDEKGKINQKAGALGRPDALALVNVMLSRARIRTAVFSSIMPWQINMSTMTPGMFLLASILRMGTVVSAPETSGEAADPMFLSDEWSVDKFIFGKEEFHAIRLPKINDKYAIAVVFRGPNGEIPSNFADLQRAGWQVTAENRPRNKEREEVLRDLIRLKLKSLGLLNNDESTLN